MKPEICIVIAGILGALGVALGAYGTHGLGGDEFYRHIFQVGVNYQLWHVLALVAAAMLGMLRPAARGAATAAAILFVAGIVCFSGALYVMALSQGATILTGVAPTGGVALMAGWLSLALAAWKARRGTAG